MSDESEGLHRTSQVRARSSLVATDGDFAFCSLKALGHVSGLVDAEVCTIKNQAKPSSNLVPSDLYKLRRKQQLNNVEARLHHCDGMDRGPKFRYSKIQTPETATKLCKNVWKTLPWTTLSVQSNGLYKNRSTTHGRIKPSHTEMCCPK